MYKKEMICPFCKSNSHTIKTAWVGLNRTSTDWDIVRVLTDEPSFCTRCNESFDTKGVK